ncbi:HAMP domain-containing histidine kinase [Synechocystis salina LEGE 06155]|nr:HAMP domain-containing histidine kinase [Synechocystis salina LEGE 06155]
MAWDIVSNPFKSTVHLSPQFERLRWQLLGAFLLVMVAINFVSSFLVYQFFAHILYQQLDQKLTLLADSAAHSLAVIKENNNTDIHHYRSLDEDGDLDLSWQGLQQPNQTIEWFDGHRRLLGSSGKQAGFQYEDFTLGFVTVPESPPVRVLVIAVYGQEDDQSKQIAGYIRAMESTESINELLSQLSAGFLLGFFATLVLISLGGLWLTQQSLKPLAKSYDQLNQFTGDASHELRSPLAVIKTSAQVLQNHPERIHPQDIQKVNNIISATNQIGCLVEDLLFLARTDNDLDLLPQSTSAIPLEELLEDVITFIEFKAEAKSINLEFHCLSKPLIKGNTFQLQRLFTNLIDNSIKYTNEQGKVSITINTLLQWAIITIEDTGMGIKKEHLPFIFERFWQAEKVRSPQIAGTGLGLAIAASIVERHQGEIRVESELGQGSCFIVLLPAVADV